MSSQIFMTPKDNKNKRFYERRQLTQRVAVVCHEMEGYEWRELGQIVDASHSGAQIIINRSVEPGQMLHLTTNLPSMLRAYDIGEFEYKIWALVRHVKVIPAMVQSIRPRNKYALGVAFTGKNPPYGFMADPSKRYELKPIPTREGLWDVRERPKKID